MWKMLKEDKTFYYALFVNCCFDSPNVEDVEKGCIQASPILLCCFDSADAGDVEIIGKVERSRGLKTYKRSPIF